MRNVKFEGDALTGGTGSGGTGGGPGTGGVGGTGGFGGGGSGGFGGGSGGGGRGGVVGANGGTGGSVDAGRDLGPQDVAAPPDAMPDRPSSPDRPPADMAPPPPPDAAASLTIGLVSRWKLDEAMGIRTEDSAGNNVGTLSGATWQTTVYPGAKYPNPAALRFAGGDHVQLGVSGMPANNRAQSVALWLNYSSARDTEVCISLTDGGGGSRVKVGFKEGRLAAFKGGTDPTLVSVAPPPPGWHHLAYTFDGNTHRLYVDGTPRAMSTITPNNGSVTSARLGGNTDGSESFTGLLDEVRVYNRALSAAEVTALHSGEQ